MSAAITVTPTSGNITAAKTVVRIDVTGADTNTATGYDSAKYPSEPAIVYYIKAVASGQPTLKSYLFSVNSDGKHTFNNLTFPGAATWTVTLNNEADDSVIATATGVVVA